MIIVCIMAVCVSAGLQKQNISKKTTFTITYNNVTLAQAAEIEQRIRKYLSDANNLTVCFGDEVKVVNYGHENTPWWDIRLGAVTPCSESLSDTLYSTYDIPVGWACPGKETE
jgi:hypothetical protein